MPEIEGGTSSSEEKSSDVLSTQHAFIDAVMKRDMPLAISLCEKLLQLDPENAVMLQYRPVLKQYQRLAAEASESSDSEEDTSDDDSEEDHSSSSSNYRLSKKRYGKKWATHEC